MSNSIETVEIAQNANTNLVNGSEVLGHFNNAKPVAFALGGVAKAQGLKIGTVRAMHVVSQGANGGLIETLTGKGAKAFASAKALQTLTLSINKDGSLKTYEAICELQALLSLKLTYGECEGYKPGLRRDGQWFATRKDWINLKGWMQIEASKVNKVGKPTPAAAHAASCLLAWEKFENFSAQKMSEHKAKITAIENGFSIAA